MKAGDVLIELDPTMTEADHPDVEGENWQAVLVPAGTPPDIVALLNREIVGIMAMPEMKERLAAVGFAPLAHTHDESAAQIKAEDRWAIIAYIRALQLSEHAAPGDVPPADRGALDGR